MTAEKEAGEIAKKLRRIEDLMFSSKAAYGRHGPKAMILFETVVKAAIMAEQLAEEVSNG